MGITRGTGPQHEILQVDTEMREGTPTPKVIVVPQLSHLYMRRSDIPLSKGGLQCHTISWTAPPPPGLTPTYCG